MTDDDDQEVESTLAEAAVAGAAQSRTSWVRKLARFCAFAIGLVVLVLYLHSHEKTFAFFVEEISSALDGPAASGSENASVEVSTIPGWRPWLEEMSAIWADGDDHYRFYFSPQGIVVDEVSVGRQLFPMGQLRPIIKGTDDDNDIVVLDVLVKPLGENVQENQEWVLRRIWNDEHTSFTLRLTFTGATSVELGFVRRFLPNELAELRVAAAAPASAYAQAPLPKATQPPPPNAPPLQEASTPIVAPALTLKFDIDEEGTRGGLELISRKDEPLSAIINTVSGPQYHTCSIEMTGLHEVQSGVSSYTWTDDETPACSISIDVRDGKATVAANNQCRLSYCGMNGGFVGTYAYQPVPR